MATYPAHETWQRTQPCRMSVALSGGGHRASAWGLGALYGLLLVRHGERAKPDGVAIEIASIASVSGGSLTNGVVAAELHARAVDLDDVSIEDFRSATAGLLATIATKGLIPAKGRTSRYVAGLVLVLLATATLFVSAVVAVLCAGRGTPGWWVLLGVYLGVGLLLGVVLSAVFRLALLVPACVLVGAAGAVTHGIVGVAHGDAEWVGVLALWVGVGVLGVVAIRVASTRGSVLERTLDRFHFRGATLAEVREAKTRHVICATELQSGHQCFFAPDIVTEWNAGEGTPGRVRLATAVRASASLPLAFPPVDFDLSHLDVHLTRPWRPSGEPKVPVGRLVLADGGVYDNMADEWEYGYPERAQESAILSPEGAANFLVVANAGKNLGWQTLKRTGRVRREIRGLERDQSIEYDETTTQRRRTLLRLFREAEEAGIGLVGVISHVPTSPLDVCAAFVGDDDRGRRARTYRAALNNMRERWSELVVRNGNVKTTLAAIGPEATIDLILHAATLTAASCYVVHGLGAPQPPTRAEVTAWVTSAVS